MNDATETIRQQRLSEINTEPGSRASLEAQYGQVWNTDELGRDFEVLGFAAPYIIVRRRVDGVIGSLEFQHLPRFYFRFEEDRP
jgi:hypothetical protein